jgi:hypothetical protein
MLEDFLIASPLIVLLGFVILAAILQTTEYLVSAGILFVCGLIFNMYLKYLFYVASSVWPKLTVKRPSDCPKETGHGCERCGLLRNRKSGKLGTFEALGMPSGHAQFMCIASILICFCMQPFGKGCQIASMLVMALWTFGVCKQRVESECHSKYQVGLGCMVGCFVGGCIVKLMSELQIKK